MLQSTALLHRHEASPFLRIDAGKGHRDSIAGLEESLSTYFESQRHEMDSSSC